MHDANEGHKSQDLLQQLGRERATIGIPGQRTACAATQGMWPYIHSGYVALFAAACLMFTLWLVNALTHIRHAYTAAACLMFSCSTVYLFRIMK